MKKLCTCWHKCKGGTEIPASTYAHHAKWRPSPLFVEYLEKEKVKYDSGTYGCPLAKVGASVGQLYQRFRETKKRETETEEERNARNREVKRRACQRWYVRNKTHMADYSKRWREKNRDRLKAKMEQKRKERAEEEKAMKKAMKKKKRKMEKSEKSGKKRDREDGDAEDGGLEDEELWGTMSDNDGEYVPAKRRKVQREVEDSDKENATSSAARRGKGKEKKNMRVSARKIPSTRRIIELPSSPRLESRQIDSHNATPVSGTPQSILTSSLKTGNIPTPDSELLKQEKRRVHWADTNARKSSPPGTASRSLLSHLSGPSSAKENAKPQPQKIEQENVDEVNESDDEDKLGRKRKMENSPETNVDESSSLSSLNSEDDIRSDIDACSDSLVSLEDADEVLAYLSVV